MFFYKRFRFLCFFIFPLSFANCLTFHLREKQNRISFYKYERPTLNGIWILQSKGHHILELYYVIKNKKNSVIIVQLPRNKRAQRIHIFTMSSFANSKISVNSKVKIRIGRSE